MPMGVSSSYEAYQGVLGFLRFVRMPAVRNECGASSRGAVAAIAVDAQDLEYFCESERS